MYLQIVTTERSARYTQLDAGHMIASLRLAAASIGWRLEVMEGLPDDIMEAYLGLNRPELASNEHYLKEKEYPLCFAVLVPSYNPSTLEEFPSCSV